MPKFPKEWLTTLDKMAVGVFGASIGFYLALELVGNDISWERYRVLAEIQMAMFVSGSFGWALIRWLRNKAAQAQG